MDRNKLTALASEHGIIGAANLLNIDKRVLESAISGESLSRFNESDIEIGLARHTNSLSDEDFEYLSDIAQGVFNVEMMAGDLELAKEFRVAFSRGQIDSEQLEEFEYLFADSYLNNGRREAILQWLTEDSNRNAEDFLSLYRQQDYDAFWFEDSEFWAWFRETFYNE